MTSPYAGTPVFAPSITLPSDGDPRIAASVAAGLSSLRDGEVFLKAVTDRTGNVGFLNWPGAASSSSSGGSSPMTRALMTYDPVYGRFWIAGNGLNNGTDPVLNVVEDYGAGISPAIGQLGTASNSLATVGSGTGDYTADVASDAGLQGAVVMSTRGRYIYQTAGSTSPSFSRVDALGTAPTAPVGAAVVYNPGSGRWLWMCNTSTSVVVRYSTNRTTWVAAGTPGWAAATWLGFKLASRASGLVMALAAAGSTIYAAASTDGGTTWATKTAITTTIPLFANMPQLGLVYDTSSSLWILTVPGIGSGSEVWTSANDGASWTKKCTLATANIGPVAPVGDGATLIGATYGSGGGGQSQIVFSTDLGTTWFRLGLGFSGALDSYSQALATPSGFAVLWCQNQNSSGAGAKALFSLRTGSNALSSQVT